MRSWIRIHNREGAAGPSVRVAYATVEQHGAEYRASLFVEGGKPSTFGPDTGLETAKARVDNVGSHDCGAQCIAWAEQLDGGDEVQ